MAMVIGGERPSTYEQADVCIDDMIRPSANMKSAPDERIWLWVLRLLLPVLILLSARVLYWIWFDNPYGRINWCDIVGGSALALGAAIVSLWAIGSWCSTRVP